MFFRKRYSADAKQNELGEAMKNERYGNGNLRFDSMFPGVELSDSGTDAAGENPVNAYRTEYDPRA